MFLNEFISIISSNKSVFSSLNEINRQYSAKMEYAYINFLFYSSINILKDYVHIPK